MTATEAVQACEFWTTNLAETVAIGSTLNDEVAAAFNCTIWRARCEWSDPQGPRHWAVSVGRWLTQRDEDGECVTVENPVYTKIAAEIERRAT